MCSKYDGRTTLRVLYQQSTIGGLIVQKKQWLDKKDGLFNPVKVEDVRNFDSVSQDAMEERAIENGILDKAFENAKNIIRKIIDNDLVEELGYTVCFETIE